MDIGPVCTWDKHSDCDNCPDLASLNCKWGRKTLLGFHGLAWPFLIAGIYGLVVTGLVSGAWWILAAYVAFLLAFLGVFEIRILCSHCPFYAKDGKILHCLANHGTFKLWRYRPGPMRRWEKTALLICLFIYGAAPILGQAYAIWHVSVHYGDFGLAALLGLIGIVVASMATLASCYLLLNIFYCAKCVNFSCPLNAVSKPVVDEYLRRSPRMREAWEECGYQLETLPPAGRGAEGPWPALPSLSNGTDQCDR